MQEKKKRSSRKIRFRRTKRAPPGSAPGLIQVAEDAMKPVVKVTSYDENTLETLEFSTVDEIKRYLETKPSLDHWVEIKGFGDKKFYEDLASGFNIHRLEIEDVLSGYQRPKVEETEGHLFIISRMFSLNQDDEIQDDQVSFFLFGNFVISIQEKSIDYFNPVKDRLVQNRGIIRKSRASYMTYALMDSLVDNFFPLLERLGIFLDDLEDTLLDSPDIYSMQNIQSTKRKLILFRRAAWAEREKLNELIRNQSALFTDTARRYLRDTYDHTIQVMDTIDSYREITASLMDIYLSSVSNRMNKVMKVLTIISTIFIPLSFIVGIYGMNFVAIDQKTGERYPFNMPELYSPYGYVGVLVAMLLIVIGQVYYFYRKGWLDWKEKY